MSRCWRFVRARCCRRQTEPRYPTSYRLLLMLTLRMGKRSTGYRLLLQRLAFRFRTSRPATSHRRRATPGPPMVRRTPDSALVRSATRRLVITPVHGHAGPGRRCVRLRLPLRALRRVVVRLRPRVLRLAHGSVRQDPQLRLRPSVLRLAVSTPGATPPRSRQRHRTRRRPPHRRQVTIRRLQRRTLLRLNTSRRRLQRTPRIRIKRTPTMLQRVLT